MTTEGGVGGDLRGVPPREPNPCFRKDFSHGDKNVPPTQTLEGIFFLSYELYYLLMLIVNMSTLK